MHTFVTAACVETSAGAKRVSFKIDGLGGGGAGGEGDSVFIVLVVIYLILNEENVKGVYGELTFAACGCVLNRDSHTVSL